MAKNRKAGMDEAAAAARGESTPQSTPQPQPAAEPKPTRTRAAAGPASEDPNITRPDNFIPAAGNTRSKGATLQARMQARSGLVEGPGGKMMTADEKVGGAGLNQAGTIDHLAEIHAALVKAHQEVGGHIANSTNDDAHRRWGNAGLHLEDAGKSIEEARRISGMFGTPEAVKEFSTKTPAATVAGHLKDAMRNIAATHRTLEHKNVRQAVGEALGADLKPGDITGYNQKGIDSLHAKIGKGPGDGFQSPNWTPKPFNEVGYGKVKVRRGSPVYEATVNGVTTADGTKIKGSEILAAAGKKAGISPRSMQRKAKQAREGTGRSSRAGRERVPAIDPKTGKPYAEGHKKFGKTVIADGKKAGEVVSGQAPNSRPEKPGDGSALSTNTKIAELMPYKTIGKPETATDNEKPAEGLTQLQRLENADAVARGQEPPHKEEPKGEVSKVTGLRRLTPDELKKASRAYTRSQRAKKRAEKPRKKRGDR
jgi:hypothetical protein